MKTSSCKAKGRLLQKLVRDALLAIGSVFGLEPDDVQSRGMGQNGVDVMYSPAARRVFGDHAWECKNVEAINLTTTFWEHAKKYPSSIALLASKRNHTEPLVTMRLNHFMTLLERSLKPIAA